MTPQYPPHLLALALYSGLAFACVGIGYRLGQARQVPTSAVAFVICVAAVAVLGAAVLRVPTPLAGVPGVVWVAGALAGLGQFGAVKLIGPALARGPLSPMWCALNLNFVVVVLYARAALGEPIPPLRSLGLALAIACVVVASLGQGSRRTDAEASATPSQTPPASRGRLVYGLLLGAILVCNAVWVTAIKLLGALPAPGGPAPTYLQLFKNHFNGAVYLALGLLLAVDLLAARRSPRELSPAVAPGLFAAAGSVTGVWALSVAGALPAAVVFTLNSVLSLLTAAIVSVLAFREPRTPSWYATLALALLSVIAVNAPGAM